MASIQRTLGSGIAFTAVAKYSNIFFSIFIGAILARLLTPAEFGIVAIVTVFVSFFNLLTNFGIGPAVVQNRDLSKEDIRSIFSLSILLGIFFAGCFFLSSSIIAGFYNEPDLVNVVRLLSVAILFYSMQIVPHALNQKKLRFKQLGIISVTVQLFSGSLAIILAYQGFSYYALVFKSIFDGLATLIAFYWLAPVKITFNIRMEAFRKIARFSSFQFMFNFINYFSRNADSLLIGKFFSAAALGYYDKSYRLMTLPVSNLTHVITPVLMPVLSEFQHDKQRIYLIYIKVVRILATIGFPLSIFLYFSAPEIIYIIYGPQWDQSIPVFKLLALTVGIQMVLSSSGSIYQAVNRTDLLFYAGFLGAILMVGGISYGVFIGESLESIGYGLIFAFTTNFFVGFYMLIKLSLKSSYSFFLKTFLFPLAISLGMALTLGLSTFLYHPDNLFLSLLLKIVVAGITFGLMFIIPRENRELLNRYVGKYLKRSK
ncbi:MAG: lipopolysaccharide biosynthesis protein [Anditalea sp.]